MSRVCVSVGWKDLGFDMTVFSVTRGSDVSLQFVVSDELGDPIDLTGGSIAFLDVSDALVSRISGAITNAASGQVVVSIEGTIPLVVGDYGFRVQILGVASSVGWPLFTLRVT